MKSIIIDVGGCDRPDRLIDGVIQAAKKHGDYAFVFVGDKAIVEPHIPSGLGNVSVEHAPTVITNDDSPTHALRQKPNSSLVRSFDLLNADDAIGLVSRSEEHTSELQSPS